MPANKIVVIDYGMGNLHSVSSALRLVDPAAEVSITSDAEAIRAADRVVFPGVGAMRYCIHEMKRLGIDKAVNDVLQTGKPLLAICVGMQSLMQFSEENAGVDCLGVFAGSVKGFSGHPEFIESNKKSNQFPMKVPHMGWNRVFFPRPHPLWRDIPPSSRFYFVHSYYVNPQSRELVAGETNYGIPFAAALAKDNVFAVQFHPEKSHKHGLQLLKNFVHWDGRLDS